MKILFITNEDPVNRTVLSGIAKSYPPSNTLCVSWDSKKSKRRSFIPTPRRVVGLLNTITQRKLDTHRTNEVNNRLAADRLELPNEQQISSRLVNSKKTAKLIADYQPDVMVVCGAPILRENIFSIPKICTINIHFGISSAYRGQHTLFWPMLENRFDQIGATIHMIDKGVDTGNLLFEVYPDVCPEDDEVSLELKIANNIVDPFVAMLQQIESSQAQQLVGQPQQATGKEIRYRDLSWWKSTVYSVKKRLGFIKIPTIPSKTKLFYEVN